MLPARENPFGVQRVATALPFDPSWCDETWEGLMQRLKTHRWRGCLSGPHGTGKTTCLDALEGQLKDRGLRVERCFLNEDSQPRQAVPWKRMEEERGRVWLVDGFDCLGLRHRKRLIRQSRDFEGLVVTVHQPSQTDLPLLLATRSSPAMLTGFVRRLAPDFSLSDDEINELFAEARGNIREALWRCYDRLADSEASRGGDDLPTDS